MAGSNVSVMQQEIFSKEVGESTLAIMAAGVSADRISIKVRQEYSYRHAEFILVGNMNLKEEVNHGT
jgi:hypothetical protein